MTKETTFAELIKGLSGFDRKLLFALDNLRTKQASTTVKTSRFELLRMLRLEYSEENADKLDESLERLRQAPLFLADTSGFAVATSAISEIQGEEDSEKLVISLGKLFGF